MADLTSPDLPKKRDARAIGSSKPPLVGTRCTYVDDGQLCNAFPSWPVPGDRNERRCEDHRDA